ncbi:hypothetical protein FKP32DRAFT_1670557 [Trametes sanguinea]|nr:hypothetical protein FKP32DRAFT_1670557 [Trametes sanguinea]
MPPIPTTIIFAKERAVLPADLPLSNKSAIVIEFDATVMPRTPLRVGDSARIMALVPCDDFFPLARDGRPRYEAKDAGVEGTITALRPLGNNLVEFIVRNEDSESPATHAHVMIVHEQGLTTELSVIEHAVVKIATYFVPPTRTVKIETDAIVFVEDRAPRKRRAG